MDNDYKRFNAIARESSEFLYESVSIQLDTLIKEEKNETELKILKITKKDINKVRTLMNNDLKLAGSVSIKLLYEKSGDHIIKNSELIQSKNITKTYDFLLCNVDLKIRKKLTSNDKLIKAVKNNKIFVKEAFKYTTKLLNAAITIKIYLLEQSKK